MNGVVRAFFVVPFGYFKLSLIKLFHWKHFRFGKLPRISPSTEITVDGGSDVKIGKKFNIRARSIIRVRKNALLIIGDNVSIAENCQITVREKVYIGDKCQIAPNVQMYDHDHDFRAVGGLAAMRFKTAPIEIGQNVWVGANVVILRGTKIGDNCVIAAGSVVNGVVPPNTVFIQKRESCVKKI